MKKRRGKRRNLASNEVNSAKKEVENDGIWVFFDENIDDPLGLMEISIKKVKIGS